MAKSAATALKTASVLAFERKLDPSDALFRAGDWNARDTSNAWLSLGVRAKSVRGTVANRLRPKERDTAKLDASITAPNLHTVDVCTMPLACDTLCTQFTLRVLGGAGQPAACNNVDYGKQLRRTVGGYVSGVGLHELAWRYAYNLANGRFLWRNRVVAEQLEVRVRRLNSGKATEEWIFDSFDLSLRSFESSASSTPALTALAQEIEQGLRGTKFLLLEVVALARVGEGQEVYPSQELILDRSHGHPGNKSKTLYSVNGTAAMHSQKLGNALRTVDTWYPGAEKNHLGPIPVEPYGSVTSQGRAYRQPKDKLDFYNLLDSWVLKEETPPVEQQHFVMANLIRGGVFGDSNRE